MKKELIFIAEIGLNHNGNFDLCFELIKQAKAAGANIVKFQLGWRDKPNEMNQFDKKRISQLIEWAKYFEIELLFSIISENAWELIKPFNFKKFKIASRTVKHDMNLAKKILKGSKETIVSLGMWDKKKPPFPQNKKIFYLWCLSKYPCEPRDLKNLPKNFNKSHYYGYSDHSIGIETSILAISRGAKIVEKHFTLDKSSTIIRDHSLSATPEEFRQMVNIGKDIFKKVNMGV
jgi:sialic acid synthase SpsE|tara:strand:+ start:10191 stop:10889 length:699 start_codon:yes stop_codon:yes gene_type:complete